MLWVLKVVMGCAALVFADLSIWYRILIVPLCWMIDGGDGDRNFKMCTHTAAAVSVPADCVEEFVVAAAAADDVDVDVEGGLHS